MSCCELCLPSRGPRPLPPGCGRRCLGRCGAWAAALQPPAVLAALPGPPLASFPLALGRLLRRCGGPAGSRGLARPRLLRLAAGL